jgi:hypothetical protein
MSNPPRQPTSHYLEAALVIQLYSVLESLQEQEPNRERAKILAHLRPVRNQLTHSRYGDVDITAEAYIVIVDYLERLEASSLGSSVAKATRLRASPHLISAALTRANEIVGSVRPEDLDRPESERGPTSQQAMPSAEDRDVTLNEQLRNVLTSIQLNSVLTPDEIWGPLNHHVDQLHQEAANELAQAILAAKRQPRCPSTGLVLLGRRGVGKTHMLGWVRQRVQREGGVFFMPKLIDAQSFWVGAVHGIVNDLRRAEAGQLAQMIDSLAELTGCDSELRLRLRGTFEVGRRDLDEFVNQVEGLDSQVPRECLDTLRALVLYQGNPRLQDIGDAFLTLAEGIDELTAAHWGFSGGRREPQLLFQDLCRLFALTGPVVLAIDQVDVLIAQSEQTDVNHFASWLAGGLARMCEKTARTIVVVGCMPRSWELIATQAMPAAVDRFTVLELATAIPAAPVAATVVERHLGTQYEAIGFIPPYPTWPVTLKAFDDPEVTAFTARRLLRRVDEHVRRCLTSDSVYELSEFGAVTENNASVSSPGTSLADLLMLDAQFDRLRAVADVALPLDPRHEDVVMPSLLAAALRCYVLEQGNEEQDLAVDPPTAVKPALHARLRRTLDETREYEEHWSFRAIASTHPRAVLSRLRSASLQAGIKAEGARKRHLVVLRNAPFSCGPATTTVLGELKAWGGLILRMSEADVRTFAALDAMLLAPPAGFALWLTMRRPASESNLLTLVFGSDSPQLEEPLLATLVDCT